MYDTIPTNRTVMSVDYIPFGMEKATVGSKIPFEDDRQAVLNQVIGQRAAIDAFYDGLIMQKQQFSIGNHDKPATYVFLGPTGVGKSETAKQVAERANPGGSGFIRINCELFSQGHEISALVGAPPSYIGRDQKPLLDPEKIERKNSVILFDEIEKATKELWNLLLGIMDSGTVTLLNSAREVSFKNTSIILTSNVGSSAIENVGKAGLGFVKEKPSAIKSDIKRIALKALGENFSPEWLNRIGNIIVFQKLGNEDLFKVLESKVATENNGSYLKQGVKLVVDPSVSEALITHPKYLENTGTARLYLSAFNSAIEKQLAVYTSTAGIPAGSIVYARHTPERGYELFHKPDKEVHTRFVALCKEEQAQIAHSIATGISNTEGPAMAMTAKK